MFFSVKLLLGKFISEIIFGIEIFLVWLYSVGGLAIWKGLHGSGYILLNEIQRDMLLEIDGNVTFLVVWHCVFVYIDV